MLKFSKKALQITKRHLDDKSEVSFLFQGIPCPIYELTTPLGKTCAGLQLIIKDLEMVEATLKVATDVASELNDELLPGEPFSKDNSKMIILNSLLTSAIVTYWKCFAKSSHRTAKIHEQKLQNVLSERLFNLHKIIQEERNSFVAHGGKNRHETGKALIIFSPLTNETPVLEFHVSFEHFSFTQHLFEFSELTSEIIRFTREIQNEKAISLCEQEIPTLNIASARANAKEFIIYHD